MIASFNESKEQNKITINIFLIKGVYVYIIYVYIHNTYYIYIYIFIHAYWCTCFYSFEFEKFLFKVVVNDYMSMLLKVSIIS